MNILYFVLFFFFARAGVPCFRWTISRCVRSTCLPVAFFARFIGSMPPPPPTPVFERYPPHTSFLLLLLLLPLSVVCVFLLRCKLSRSTIPSAIVSFLHRLLCLYPPPLHPRLVSPLFICSHATSPPKNAFSIPRPRCISKYLPMLLLHCTVLFPPVSILFSFCFSPVSFFYLSPATPNPHLYYTTTKYFFLPVASS